MTNHTEMERREKFEAWAEEVGAKPCGYLKKQRNPSGGYSVQIYTYMWTAWKAAGAELVEALEKAKQMIDELECRMALAAMDSEPVIVVGDDGGDALSYRRLIQSFEPGTKLYLHAQPAPVVPKNCVTAEHRRVIEMLLNVCGAAFELADDSCQQDVDGEDCHVVPDDAFQKLSDALDEIENTLPTEDIDRPDVFLAWSAMPRAALKSILHAQPAPERDQVRSAHAEWSQATFGNVGPVGPLKHLSKEALEAAAEPGDLSEWADMQFLMWDAQRRAGITDEQITQAMIDKLAVNRQRSWPEPKDGEPRLHIKEQPAPVAPVVPDFKKLARVLVDNLVDCGGLDEGVEEKHLEWAEKTCRAAMLAATQQERK